MTQPGLTGLRAGSVVSFFPPYPYHTPFFALRPFPITLYENSYSNCRTQLREDTANSMGWGLRGLAEDGPLLQAGLRGEADTLAVAAEAAPLREQSSEEEKENPVERLG